MSVELQTRVIELEDEVARLEARIAELDMVHRVKVDKLRGRLESAQAALEGIHRAAGYWVTGCPACDIGRAALDKKE